MVPRDMYSSIEVPHFSPKASSLSGSPILIVSKNWLRQNKIKAASWWWNDNPMARNMQNSRFWKQYWMAFRRFCVKEPRHSHTKTSEINKCAMNTSIVITLAVRQSLNAFHPPYLYYYYACLPSDNRWTRFIPQSRSDLGFIFFIACFAR